MKLIVMFPCAIFLRKNSSKLFFKSLKFISIDLFSNFSILFPINSTPQSESNVLLFPILIVIFPLKLILIKFNN